MRSLLLLCLLGLCPYLQAQQASGSWYGRADVLLEGNHSNYLTELIIKQKGSEVEGIMGYYYKNLYQSFFVRGTYNESTRLMTIRSLPLLYFRSDGSRPTVTCTMDFEARLLVSKAGSTLQGYFLRDEKYKYTCPDLEIQFTRDVTETNTDSAMKLAVATTKIWKPAPDEAVVTPAMVQELRQAPTTETMTAFEQRKPYVINEILVESDSLRITLYDNGDIDGDTVSVFYNKVPVLTKQGLTAQGTNLFIGLVPDLDVHELSLYAENMGSIPPNTALLVIYDGMHRHEVFSTSNLSLNGTIRIRKKKANPVTQIQTLRNLP